MNKRNVQGFKINYTIYINEIIRIDDWSYRFSGHADKDNG